MASRRIHLIQSVLLGVLSAWALFLFGGCQSAQVAEPLTGPLAGNEPPAQMAFWHTLGERPVVSNDEAFHAMLLFLDGKDEAADYTARVEAMKQRALLPRHFDQPANLAVRRGDVAVAVCRILEIKGGVVMRLTGLTPRYCTRELEYLKIYSHSSPNQTFSGGDFLSLIGKVEDMQTLKGRNPLLDVQAPPEAGAPAQEPAQAPRTNPEPER